MLQYRAPRSQALPACKLQAMESWAGLGTRLAVNSYKVCYVLANRFAVNKINSIG